MKEGINYNNCKYEMERPSHCATHLLSRYRTVYPGERKSKIWLLWIRLREVHTWYTACTWDFPPAGERSLELLFSLAIGYLK